MRLLAAAPRKMMPICSANLDQPRAPAALGHAGLRLVREAPPAAGALHIGATLDMLAERLPVQRSVLHIGDAVHRAGQVFSHVYVLNAGFVKVINSANDGRVQVVGLNFRGDWLGFDGIADGRHGCDAVALETGEIWALPYPALLHACLQHPPLLAALHAQMSHAITRSRDSMFSRCTLPAAARVAEFLRQWACARGVQGQRADQFTLRMTRAEIGDYLGMTLESVSRAMSSMVQAGVIHFTGTGRRNVNIPDMERLGEFIHEDERHRA
jgi:CRP/FNR family transcriptional regulator